MAPQHEDAAEADFNKTSSTNATTTAETGAAEETVNNNNNNNIKKNNGTKAVADPPGDHLATSSKDNDEDNDEDGVNVESNKPLVENEPNKQATMEEEATDAESKKPIQQPQTPKDSTATPSSIAAAAVVVAAGTLSSSAMAPVVLSSTSTKKSSNSSRPPPYKYNPEKITLRFLFCNRDGLTVTVECNPTDTVGEVKGALISVWPKDMPDCETGENVRLICMGKGYLSPDTKTLADCQIPVFKTHPTPVNVSVKPSEKKPVPKASDAADRHNRKGGSSSAAAGNGHSTSPTNAQSTTGANNVPSSSSSSAVESGCGCMIQ